MQQESLEETFSILVDGIDKSKTIPIADKVELMKNLRHFLNALQYENNIRVLEQERLKQLREKSLLYNEPPETYLKRK